MPAADAMSRASRDCSGSLLSAGVVPAIATMFRGSCATSSETFS